MRRHVALGALAFAVLLGTAGPGAHGASAQGDGSFGIRLVDVPPERADDPRAHNYVVDHLEPGDRVQRRVEVSNRSGDALDLQLYAAAADVRDGAFVFGEGRAPNELTQWTTVSPTTLTVPAEGRATATVTIEVAGGATSGEHYGVVWAEARSPARDGGVSTVNRVGVRMYVSIGAGGEPPSDFEIHSLTAARDGDGRPVVRARVENTGGRALDLTGRLELDDGPGGAAAGAFPVELGTTLAPGDTAPATVVLDDDLPAGPWHAVVTVRSGTLAKQAEATITFPSGRARSAGAVAAKPLDGSGSALARGLLAAAVAMLTAGGLVVMARRGALSAWRRRRPGPPPAPGPGDPPPPPRRDSGRARRPRPGAAEHAARGRRPPAPRGRAPDARRPHPGPAHPGPLGAPAH